MVTSCTIMTIARCGWIPFNDHFSCHPRVVAWPVHTMGGDMHLPAWLWVKPLSPEFSSGRIEKITSCSLQGQCVLLLSPQNVSPKKVPLVYPLEKYGLCILRKIWFGNPNPWQFPMFHLAVPLSCGSTTGYSVWKTCWHH